MLERQGIVMNQKKLRRLYREEKLQVRRRGGRKRALGTRRPMLVPDRANARLLSAMLCIACRAEGASTSSRTPSPTGGDSGSWL
jgi:transposase InsO family protein